MPPLSKILLVVMAIILAMAAYVYFGIKYGDAIEARRPPFGDKRVSVALNQMREDDFLFLRLAGDNLSAIKIAGKEKICYFFYSKKPISINDSDFLYCFDKATGAFLGRM